MTSVLRRAADRALTVGAVLGVIALVAAGLAVALGVRPLFFRSGSMAPTIDTGSMALARRVPAGDLRVGDVVSVRTAAGVRVTHRVVRTVPSGDQVLLTLRGDANRAADPECYAVGSAFRVFWHVPWVGYAAASVQRPVGLFLLGLLFAGTLSATGRPVPGSRRRSPRHVVTARSRHRAARTSRRAVRAGAAAVVTAAAVTGSTGPASAAPWTDPVPVSADYAAHTVLPPTSTTCSASTPSATISWPEKDPRYDYEVQLKDWAGSVVSTNQVTGAAVSQTYSGAWDFGLYVLALGVYDYTVEIRSYLATTTGWRGAGVLVATQKIRVSVIMVIVPVLGTVSCV